MQRLFSLTICAILAAGCADIRIANEKSNLLKVEAGMTKANVFRIMDRLPNSSIKFGTEEVLNWDATSIVFSRGKVAHKTNSDAGIVDVSVESYKGSEKPKKKIAIIMPSIKGMTKHDLEFLNIKKIIAVMLKLRGYKISDNESEADTVVFVNFGISEPKNKTTNWSEPVYEYIMPTPQQPQQSKTTHTVTNQYGQNLGAIESTTTTGNPYAVQPVIPQQVYRGERSRSVTTTTYVRHLIVEAGDFQYFKNNEVKQYWKFITLSEGASGDLRNIVPFLAIASKSFIGWDSRIRQRGIIFLNDPRVKKLITITAPPSENESDDSDDAGAMTEE